MTSSSLVSVIVTCFNQKHCVARSIESVIRQTYRDLECIVVDDGSTDGSAGVVAELAQRDSRVQLIQQGNAGVAAARNTGFLHARGHFIQFLDGDDLLHTEKLHRQFEHLASDATIDVSCVNHDFLDANSGRFRVCRFDPIDEYPLEQMLFRWFDGSSLPIHAGMYRRSIWGADESPFPSDYQDRCEDWVFLVFVAMKGARFSYLDEILCTYRTGQGNFTAAAKDWNVASIVAAKYLSERIPEAYRERFFRDAVERTLDRYHRGLKSDVLHGSKNWQIGNFLTRPFFKAYQLFTRTN